MTQKSTPHDFIVLEGASVHNLQDIDLHIPHKKLVVITGVSGSGKSSLAFDTICREGQRRYLESFSTRARQLLGKLGSAKVRSIRHLSPAIAINQKTAVGNPRSTVGTMSELYDHLRLLFARFGQAPDGVGHLSRSLFSFNAHGACPTCAGLGVTDRIDAELLVKDPALTLREGALVITTDSGYIIYSQVTMDVLDDVCHAHGFHVDIPWKDLTPDQKQVILYGSQRLKIPFGKHTLESRMKWSGITARPRQEGYYGGIIPIMENILKRDRNKNILRFARTGNCPDCQGTRLCPEALGVSFLGRSIADFSGMTIGTVDRFFRDFDQGENNEAQGTIIGGILRRTGLLLDLGLGYLTLDRSAPTLSGGEAQRIRLAGIVGSGLQDMTYVLDEPSVGLHPRDNDRLLLLLRRLVDQGNSVIVVEHDERTMLAADWLIDIGPGAGKDGGKVLFSGPPEGIIEPVVGASLETSLTRRHLLAEKPAMVDNGPCKAESLVLVGAATNNLQGFDASFPIGALTVVTGVSGAGKSSLLEALQTQVRTMMDHDPAACPLDQLVTIDQSPIGRTPRSNAATYTGLFDPVRALFASQPAATGAKLGKGMFSFNNKGGRCEDCQGAGVQTVGMHFLGDVESTCTSCAGQRFQPDILAVTYKGKNISQVLEMSVEEAAGFFAGEIKIHRPLVVLQELGLGYLPLGQPSTTLSGGEAQRIKLAAELGRKRKKSPLYILDEPTTGLHAADVDNLLRALQMLAAGGATVVVSEHHEAMIRAAHCLVDLGPGSGVDGGRLLYCGPPCGLASVRESVTGAYLFGVPEAPSIPAAKTCHTVASNVIALRGVQTHNLKNIDLDIPKGKITVITGRSGSGKSSLAMATLCAEGRNRYAENFSTYMRQMLTGRKQAQLTSCAGLSPTIAIGQNPAGGNQRSIVATVSEIHPLLRLLMARFGENPDDHRSPPPAASQFSFNNHQSACPKCLGLGSITVVDAFKLISHPEKSLLDGAMDGHKTGRFYGEPDGQYTATLRAVGAKLGIDFSIPWERLSPEARNLAMEGTGQDQHAVSWKFQRGGHGGTHDFQTAWPGFFGHILEEYGRKHADNRGQAMMAIMKQDLCPACHGKRLSATALNRYFSGQNMADLCAMTVWQSLDFFSNAPAPEQLRWEISARLQTLADLGLGYLSLDRSTATLSSGESQRVRLARQLGARLCGITYVLDEPTLGLHPRDTERLWQTISRLRDDGNTVVIVEHDLAVIRQADWIVDMGPGAGVHGGEILVQGTAQQVMDHAHSPTGLALREPLPCPPQAVGDFGKQALTPEADILVCKATLNNLQDIDVGFCSGRMTAVVGVSGSGKSSLVFGVLAASALEERPIGCLQVDGLQQFSSIVPIGQASQSATTGSNPATVLGVLDPLRKMLAATDAAKTWNLKKKDFATAQPGGRCEECKGRGQLTVSLDFLADVSRVCSSCQGTGFTEKVLQCRIHERNLPELLALTVDEAAAVFHESRSICKKLTQLAEVGLGYLTLGQETGTLSGGERQRLHLARELLTAGKNQNLYLCDEPSAGLHEADIQLLVALLRKLVGGGHTVVFTDHHQGLISAADDVVEMGGIGGGLCRFHSPKTMEPSR